MNNSRFRLYDDKNVLQNTNMINAFETDSFLAENHIEIQLALF